MSKQVLVRNGVYKIGGRDRDVSGYQFDLVNGYSEGTRGAYVTVNGASAQGGSLQFPPRNIRIRIQQEDDIQVIDDSTAAEPEEVETDEAIIERTRERFEVLNDMTRAVKAGHVRAMIVSGPPGVGKSWGVENVLGREDLFNKLGNRPPKYEIVKGHISTVGLYKKLYEFSGSNCVVVFDDCDSVLLDEDSLNILKGALDSSTRRVISWHSESRVLHREDVPNSFEFRGGAIFITNVNFNSVRSKKLRDHLAALESRCHYVDLKMHTLRERLLRIRQIVSDGMLSSYNFDSVTEQVIVEFVVENAARLREVSLRTVLKIADLRASFPDRWQQMAKVTVMQS